MARGSKIGYERNTRNKVQLYVPDTPLKHVCEPSPLLRNPTGDPVATAPTYGSGPFSLFEKRRIQRQIHQLLNNRSRQLERSDDVVSVSSTTLFGSQIVSMAPHNGSQAQTPTTTDHRASNNSIASSPPPVARETFDLNEMYVPDTPLTQVCELSPLLRNPTGDPVATSPTYGSGPFTLFEKRRIQRQIHQLLNNRSRRLERSDDVVSVSSTTLFGSQIVSMAPHNGVVPVRAAPESVFDQGRLSDYGTPLMYSREGISPRFGCLMGQMPQDQGSTWMAHSFVGVPQNKFGGIEERIDGGGGGHQQLRPCSGRSNNGVGASIFPFQFQEATEPSRTLEGSPRPPF